MDEADEPDLLHSFGLHGPGDDWLASLRSAVGFEGAAPAAIGPYEIEGVAGRGGQGVVYRARQGERTVALKCLAPAFLSDPEAISRFRREVELTMSLRHSGIVTVHGMHVFDGRPTICMEWVEGRPITEWATPSGRLRPVREIVAVVLQLCAAVRHAHQRGVLHRDLKPSNVLVDENGVPRVLDFGVAKDVVHDPTVALTARGDFVGTLAYAAPEQLRGDPAAVDARADVFAIGRILYETLTGARPFAVDDDVGAMLDVLTRGLRPSRPSQRRAGIDRELDTIVARAQEADAARRYQSVDALLEDLRRWTVGEPILAHPPSTWYQLRKLVARHRLVVGLTVLAVAAVVALGAVAWVQARALVRANERAALARHATDEVTAYIHELFRDLSPHVRGEPATVTGMIERAVARIDRHFEPASSARAELRETIGVILVDLGRPRPAIAVLEEALRTHGEVGTGPVGRARCRVRLARALRLFSEYERAREHVDIALRIHEESADVPLADRIEGLEERAELSRVAGRYASARASLETIVELVGAASDPRRDRLADGYASLVEVHGLAGEHASARDAARRVVELRTAEFGARHPSVGTAWLELGGAMESCGAIGPARDAVADGIGILEETLGARHPRTAAAWTQLAELEFVQGRTAEAGGLFQRALDVLIERGHEEREVFAHALQGRAATLMHTEGLDAAEAMLRQSLTILEQRLDGPQLAIATVRANLAAILGQRGYAALDRAAPVENADLVEARRLLSESLSIREQVLGPNHLQLAHAINGLGAIASYLHDWSGAERRYLDAMSRLQSGFPDGHPMMVTVATNLAAVERDRARANAVDAAPELAVADRRFVTALEVADRVGLGAFHPDRTFLLHQRAIVLGQMERADEQIHCLEAVADADPGDRADAEGFVDDAHLRLVHALVKAGRLDAAGRRLDFLRAKLGRVEGGGAIGPDRVAAAARALEDARAAGR